MFLPKRFRLGFGTPPTFAEAILVAQSQFLDYPIYQRLAPFWTAVPFSKRTSDLKGWKLYPNNLQRFSAYRTL